jgi:hypothetical protein
MTLRHVGAGSIGAALIAVTFFASAPVLAARGPVVLTTPVETPGQFTYTFVGPFGGTSSDGEWVAIDFHREPGCAELVGFNLLLFVDPNAFGCALTVEMREWWYREDIATAGGPWGSLPWEPTFRTPVLAEWRGLGAVPIYFVLEAELVDAMADDVLTVDELENLPSLQIGRATRYQFIQHNSSRRNASRTQRPGHTRTVAHGVLLDGRSFQFNLTTLDNEITSIKIEFK